MIRTKTVVVALAVLAMGCTQSPSTGTGSAASPARANTVLHDPSGRDVGKARVQQAGGGIRISLQVSNLPAGTHGVHVHAVGRCAPPDFASAGPHWNPTARQHGKDNPAGMHKGDLPNILVVADGRGKLTFDVADASLGALLDADGAALVVHAAADDYRTDPSGNSGARIACGVLGTS